MVKTTKFIFIISFLLSFISCPLRYNSAIIKVYNNSSTTFKYKGLLIDEQSGNEPGEMIIKVISPTKNNISYKETDSFDLTWANFQKKVFVNITWGESDVYHSSTGFFEVRDMDIITISLDSSNDWHFKN